MGTLTDPEHDRDVGPVHVSIEQANPCPCQSQGDRDVDRYGCLADTALAGADGDGIANAGDLLASRQPARGADVGVPGDLDARDTRHNADHCSIDVVSNSILQWARGGREHHANRCDPTLDCEITQHPELQHRLVQFGIDDGCERTFEGVERPGITHLRSSIPRLPPAEAPEGCALNQCSKSPMLVVRPTRSLGSCQSAALVTVALSMRRSWTPPTYP